MLKSIEVLRLLNNTRLALGKRSIKNVHLNEARELLVIELNRLSQSMEMRVKPRDLRLLSYRIVPREDMAYLKRAIQRIIDANKDILVQDESECRNIALKHYGIKSD